MRNTAGRQVRPAFLLTVEGGESDPKFYWTSNSTAIKYENNTYYPIDFSIKGLSWELKGSGKISIQFSNFNNDISTLALQNYLSDVQVSVVLIYVYDRQNFFAVGTTNAIELNYSLAVKEIIPKDIPQTGILYTVVSAENNLLPISIGYNSYIGNRFTTTANINIQEDVQLYIPKTSYNLQDASLLFYGTTDDIEIGETTVNITIIQNTLNTQYTPRRRMIKTTGFNHLPVTGTKLVLFGEVFILEKQRV